VRTKAGRLYEHRGFDLLIACRQELWAFGIRVLMTFVSVFIYSPMWASVVQLILSSWLTYLIWYWQPQLEGWVNHVRTGMYASVAWCSLLYAISAYNIGKWVINSIAVHVLMLQAV
jgi:hypothetical protein